MNVGFLSTRLAGTDGVSLETAKIAEITERMGHRTFYCAGELSEDGPAGRCIPELHFNHPEIRRIHDDMFGGGTADLRVRIRASAARLRPQIAEFLEGLDLLVVENALTIPMNIPLGVVLRDLIFETGIPTLAHHHDFYWERSRFADCALPDILNRCFPPELLPIRHVVINSLAQQALQERRGIESRVLPNVLDFERGPEERQARTAELRESLRFGPDDLMILQPTRVVPRKGIERSIELVARLSECLTPRRVGLLITHPAGDEGIEYLENLQAKAHSLEVRLELAAERFAARREEDRGGNRRFDLRDAYACADFVAYPSRIEGFGNAFLEAVFYRRPVMVNRYPVFVADIEPHGFDVVAIDDVVTEATVRDVVELLLNPERRDRMTERNYTVASRHFSYCAARVLLEEIFVPFS